MVTSSIEAFTQALSQVSSSTTASTAKGLVMERVAILGAGPNARVMAAACYAQGTQVSLFSAYGKELDELRQSGSISINGAGPIGTYRVDNGDKQGIAINAALDTVVTNADVIFLTGPLHKQRTYAMVLADHLQDGQLLVLPQARTFGAAEMARMLDMGGCTANITILEVNKWPFWITSSTQGFSLTESGGLSGACWPSGEEAKVAALDGLFPGLHLHLNGLHSGFSDGSGLVELTALLCGGPACAVGGPKVPMAGVPLPENQTFRNLIGPAHGRIIASLAKERRLVAQAFGVRDLPSDDAWMTTYAGTPTGVGSRPVPCATEAMQMVRCGALGSLMPLVSAAQTAGHDVPTTQAMVSLASATLNTNLLAGARNLLTAGVSALNVDQARHQFEALARGDC